MQTPLFAKWNVLFSEKKGLVLLSRKATSSKNCFRYISGGGNSLRSHFSVEQMSLVIGRDLTLYTL